MARSYRKEISPSDKKGIGTRLRKLRKASGKSMYQIANDIGINESTLSLIETGGRLPRLDTISMLAKYHGVTIDYIVYGDHATGIVIESLYDLISHIPPPAQEEIRTIVEAALRLSSR